MGDGAWSLKVKVTVSVCSIILLSSLSNLFWFWIMDLPLYDHENYHAFTHLFFMLKRPFSVLYLFASRARFLEVVGMLLFKLIAYDELVFRSLGFVGMNVVFLWTVYALAKMIVPLKCLPLILGLTAFSPLYVCVYRNMDHFCSTGALTMASLLIFFLYFKKKKRGAVSWLLFVLPLFALASSSTALVYFIIFLGVLCIQDRQILRAKKLYWLVAYLICIFAWYYTKERSLVELVPLTTEYHRLVFFFLRNPIFFDYSLLMAFVFGIVSFFLLRKEDRQVNLIFVVPIAIFFLGASFLSQTTLLKEYSVRYLKYLIVCVPFCYILIVQWIFSIKNNFIRWGCLFIAWGIVAFSAISFSVPLSKGGASHYLKWRQLIIGPASDYYSFLFLKQDDYLVDDVCKTLEKIKHPTYVYEVIGNDFQVRAFKYFSALKYQKQLPQLVKVNEFANTIEHVDKEEVQFFIAVCLDNSQFSSSMIPWIQKNRSSLVGIYLQTLYGFKDATLLEGYKIVRSDAADHFVLMIPFSV